MNLEGLEGFVGSDKIEVAQKKGSQAQQQEFAGEGLMLEGQNQTQSLKSHYPMLGVVCSHLSWVCSQEGEVG